ncbi:peptidase domain-containing ABC transporter [Paraneptunicella aestuarii]|uniref:peptidase domain-containing ABC transporter n=1 Tax=Paraneptunicella aestuarii TaxID=2831148 RepID=UPI001E2FBC88|nr:peptidase domain-containing ABC transporter [Paraneptunicella aestuarii]UAA38827.1 peptidase domain-containing ABC transporter [Paraneptunicella aestuarii]
MAIQTLLNKARGNINQLPIIYQSEAAECGLACLAMICGYWNKHISLETLRTRHRVSNRGLTVQNLIELSHSLGLSARPLRAEIEYLEEASLPAILHWDLKHFVVLKAIKGNQLIIIDPAMGERHISWSEADKRFTGIILELEPTIEFVKENKGESFGISNLLTKAHGLKSGIVKVISYSLLLQLVSLALPLFIQFSIDELVSQNAIDTLNAITFGVLALIIVAFITQLVRGYLLLHMGYLLSFQLARNILSHLLKLPIPYFEKRNIGDFISRISSLEPIKELLTTGVASIFIDGIMVIGSLALMLYYSANLTLIPLVGLSLYFIFKRIIVTRQKQLTHDEMQTKAEESSTFIETLNAVSSIKLYNKESTQQAKWENAFVDSLAKSWQLGKLQTQSDAVLQLSVAVETILIVYFSVFMISDSTFSIGMLFAYLSLRQNFSDRARAVVDKWTEYQMVLVHTERLKEIVSHEPEPASDQLIPEADKLANITCSNLSFRYGDGEPWIFDNANIEIKAKKNTAIIGPSGAGKTTLFKILLGILHADTGIIKIGATTLTPQNTRDFRNSIAVVLQEDQMLRGSIAENITFYDDAPNQEEIENAARSAAIHDDIIQMPMGYQTIVGEMGHGLSGGQLQRIFLARALYKRPKILFIDEGTSHLDLHTEKQVNENLKKLEITRIFIAHRPETISYADEVIQVENGRISKVSKELSDENGILIMS